MPPLDFIELSSESEYEDTVVVKHEDANTNPLPQACTSSLISGNPRPPSIKHESENLPIGSHGASTSTSASTSASVSTSYIPATLREEIDKVKREIDGLQTLLARACARRDALYEDALRRRFAGEFEVKAEAEAEVGPRKGPSGLGRKSRHMRENTHKSTETSTGSVATERRGVISVGSSVTPAATAKRRNVISVRSTVTPAAKVARMVTTHQQTPEVDDSGVGMQMSMDMDIDPDGPVIPDDDDNDVEQFDGPGLSPAGVTATPVPCRSSNSTARSASQSSGNNDRNPTTIEEAIQNLRPAPERFACTSDVYRTWTRKHISRVIGGGPQDSWPGPDKNKSFPYRISCDYYICIKRDLNQWLPRNPGDRGGLTVFRKKAIHDHVYPLFIQFQQNRWKYMGNYRAVNLPINGGYLPLAQWRQNFTRKQKLDWASHIISKAWGRQILFNRGVITGDQFDMKKDLKNALRPEDLVRFFERGDDDPMRLRLQVRLLEPHSFDRRLYDILARYGHEDEDEVEVEVEAEDADGEDEESQDEEHDAGPRIRGAAMRTPVQRHRRNAVLHNDEPFQPPNKNENDSYEEHDSDSDALPRHQRRRKSLSATCNPQRTQTRTLRQKLPTCWTDLDSGDENTLHRYKPAVAVAPAAPSPASPTARPGRIKRERTESDDDELYARPATRPRTSRSRSQSVELVGLLTPWQAPTAWNEAVAFSANPDRKAYAHELVTVWPPYSFPNHEPPLLPLGITRAFLSNYIGGGAQRVKCTVSVQKALKNNHRINIYHCVDPKWNPHLPKKPGGHGVVYYPTPLPEESGMDPDLIHHHLVPVFCRRARNNWVYMGEYLQTRRVLIPGEWEQIPYSTKQCWSEGFSGKRKGGRSGEGPKWGKEFMEGRGFLKPGETMEPEDVLKLIDEGRFTMEAVLYECRGYNWNLHEWLKEKWEASDIKMEPDDE
jgi:hypothetical protein